MKRVVDLSVARLELRTTFQIAHGASDFRDVLRVSLAQSGEIVGRGEAAPVRYLGDSLDEAREYVEHHAGAAARIMGGSSVSPADIDAALPRRGSRAGRAALEMALLDAVSSAAGVSMRQFLNVPEAEIARYVTSVTLPIAEPARLVELCAARREARILKVKLGGAADLAALGVIVDARPDATLRIDANAGWTEPRAREVIVGMRQLLGDRPERVEFIEQPFAGIDATPIERLRREWPGARFFADEPIRDVEDVHRAARIFDGVNVKVQKAGGLVAAMECMRAARDEGLAILLGCMIESSLGVTAAAALAGMAHALDLDGPLLIANDDYEGLSFHEDGRFVLPDRPGIGARLLG